MTAGQSEEIAAAATTARDQLDAHTVESVQWHFHESTGSPFWLEKKSELNRTLIFNVLSERVNLAASALVKY